MIFLIPDLCPEDRETGSPAAENTENIETVTATTTK